MFGTNILELSKTLALFKDVHSDKAFNFKRRLLKTNFMKMLNQHLLGGTENELFDRLPKHFENSLSKGEVASLSDSFQIRQFIFNNFLLILCI
jgi:hypothetical protein